MPVLKCKMCGGALQVEEGQTICECEYCGSRQTVPNLDNEKKIKLYERANKLRANNEFDKAYGVYQQITNEFTDEAEAYWGMLLCKYGIEYVEDHVMNKWIPTCHRSSFESILDDEDFEMVMENADGAARGIYREEAKTIENIREKILEISSKEEPYDIFICYKETDEYGKRTVDSVMAQDVYNALCEKGYKVFFSRITLEDKLGQEYEPYIFAALNSAKVMLAFGTSYDYYNAVWVKNEWSRFLQMIASGAKKTLIPCYKNIDAYDIPKEFAHLQGQDMGKVGAMQDLLRGIEKIIPRETKTASAGTASTNTAGVESLLKRTELFLKDRDFKKADEYCERILDIEPENAMAYFFKLLAQYKCSDDSELRKAETSFRNNRHFMKAYEYGDKELKNRLDSLLKEVEDNIRAREEKEAEETATRNEQTRISQEKKAREDYVKKLEVLTAKDAWLEDISCVAGVYSACRDYQDVESSQELMKRAEDTLNSLIQKERQNIESLKEKLQKNNSLIVDEQMTQDAICSITDTINSLNYDVKAFEKELSQLGLFNGKRKNEIREKIGSLQQEITEEKHKIEQYKQQLQRNMELSKTNASLEKDIESLQQNALDFEDVVSQYTAENHYQQLCTRLAGLTLSVGDVITIGNYPQYYDSPSPVDWYITEIDGANITLISKYALDAKHYNDPKNPAKIVGVLGDQTPTSWRECTLRKWLNTTFLNKAFNASEIERLVKFPYWEDYVSIPTQDFANKLPRNLCVGKLTNYAIKNGASNILDGKGWWWLTSPGAHPYLAKYVNEIGLVNDFGHAAGDKRVAVAVRPIVILDIEK